MRITGWTDRWLRAQISAGAVISRFSAIKSSNGRPLREFLLASLPTPAQPAAPHLALVGSPVPPPLFVGIPEELNAPRIVLLNDPTRGIDVGTKQEIHLLLRRLAEEGAAVLLYSTDYAELIGCCDRVAVFFDGRIVRWLAGDALTEHALVASALNIDEGDAR